MSQDEPDDEFTEKTAIVHVRLTATVKVPVDDLLAESSEKSSEELMQERAYNKVRGSEMDYVFGGPLPRGMADISANDVEVVALTD